MGRGLGEEGMEAMGLLIHFQRPPSPRRSWWGGQGQDLTSPGFISPPAHTNASQLAIENVSQASSRKQSPSATGTKAAQIPM